MYEFLNLTRGNALTQTVIFIAVFVSNALVATVWLSKENRTPISILLSVIALYDTLTIACGTTNTLTSYIAGQLFSTPGCYVVKVASTLAFVFHCLSISCTTFLAVQRSIVCAFPFSGPKLCGLKATTIFVPVSFAAVVIAKLPEFLFYDIEGVIMKSEDNTSVLYCKVNYILDDPTVSKLSIFYLKITYFVYHLIPSTIITFCIIVCLVTINRNKFANQELNQRRKTKTTIMLLPIMIIFVLGELPKGISLFVMAFLPTDEIWLTTPPGDWFSNMAVVTSFLVNIWVYIAMSKQFRESMKKKCCFCRKEKSLNKQVKTSVTTSQSKI